MSWQASSWADSLPYDVVGHLAYRVLNKLANVANVEGTIAFRDKAGIAEELGVSQRSVQRAYRELEAAALIHPGDQSYVRHIRADKRPTVYELNYRWKTQYSAPELPWPEALDGETERGDRVIHNPERGDNYGPSGETTAVAQGTINELSREISRGNHKSDGLEQLRALCAPPFKVHSFDENGYCRHSCGVHADGRVISPLTGDELAPARELVMA